MKKVLIASTALIAVSLATGAQASEKIKLQLGGYSKWWVVGAWQDSDFQGRNNADFNSVDIKGDNEVFFGGETTLNNGLKVGINIELEAGGNTETTTNRDVIDKSSVFVEGGFGKVILGSEANGAALLHVMAPDAAGNIDSDGILTGGFAINQANVNYSVTTAIDTDDNAEKITYVAPTFYGLTVGATYVPNAGGTEDTRATVDINSAAATGEIYGVGALYANTFGPVGLKVSGGWVTYDFNQITVANPTPKDGVQEFSAGTQLSYGNFTIGGSYRQINADSAVAAGLNGNAWDAGVQYASGPYAVSFYYLDSKRDGAAGSVGDDEATIYQVSGKYSMGPGVDALATIGHAEFEDETGLAANENKGWAVMTGLSLAF